MPRRPSTIAPTLQILAKEVSILLPADGAVEDLRRPDADETGDAEARVIQDKATATGETTPARDALTYTATLAIPRPQRHLFRYFIDGSPRTLYIATSNRDHNWTASRAVRVRGVH
jgi:hypothetical protein